MAEKAKAWGGERMTERDELEKFDRPFHELLDDMVRWGKHQEKRMKRIGGKLGAE